MGALPPQLTTMARLLASSMTTPLGVVPVELTSTSVAISAGSVMSMRCSFPLEKSLMTNSPLRLPIPLRNAAPGMEREPMRSAVTRS